MMLKPHTGTAIVKGRQRSGEFFEGTGINVDNGSAEEWYEVSRAVPGVVMCFGRMP